MPGGPRTWDGRKRIRISATEPEHVGGVLTATAANAMTKAECKILKAGYDLGADASDTIADSFVCTEGNATSFGASNYSGSMTVVRFLDEDGLPVEEDDDIWAMSHVKGTRLWILDSDGPHHGDEFEDGQEYSLFEVVTDNPGKPGDRTGWIKYPIPLGVQNAWLFKTIAAVAPGG